MKAKKAVYPIVLAVVTVLYIAFLVGVIVVINNTKTIINSNGDMAYTEDAIKTMRIFSLIPTAIYACCVIACGIISIKVPYVYVAKIPFRKMKATKEMNPTALFVLRVSLIATFVALVIVGVIGGAYSATYMKAIYICRECLGIG